MLTAYALIAAFHLGAAFSMPMKWHERLLMGIIWPSVWIWMGYSEIKRKKYEDD